MTSAFSSGLAVISLLIFLALMSGFWAGLWGLWKSRRGVAWWLMATGIAFSTVGPPLYMVGTWLVIESFSSTAAAGGPPSASGFGFTTPILMVISGFMIPIGLLLFSIGFAIHGISSSRVSSRAAELEALTGAMSEEINRLRAEGARD